MSKTFAHPRDLYPFYNARYFRNRLPDLPVVFRTDKKMPNAVAVTEFRNGTPVKIAINSRYKKAKSIWYFYLLHEMVHVEQRKLPRSQAHGHKFQRRMKQLANLGAFNRFW